MVSILLTFGGALVGICLKGFKESSLEVSFPFLFSLFFECSYVVLRVLVRF